MRLWSIHPQYLDAKGLVALWREGLLAKKVLEGKTNGYTAHPQLVRFKESSDPVAYINEYLYRVFLESRRREYSFDGNKVSPHPNLPLIQVTDGQLLYELGHLRRKLKVRDMIRFKQLQSVSTPTCHPVFESTPGDVASWEIVEA